MCPSGLSHIFICLLFFFFLVNVTNWYQGQTTLKCFQQEFLFECFFGCSNGSSKSGSFGYLGSPNPPFASLPPKLVPWQSQTLTPWTIWTWLSGLTWLDSSLLPLLFQVAFLKKAWLYLLLLNLTPLSLLPSSQFSLCTSYRSFWPTYH